MDPRKRTVQAGYDELSPRYLAWASAIEDDPRERFTAGLEDRLPEGSVLELGCGVGLPSTRRLAERFEVVGVDLSEEQLKLARENVPGASFLQGDFVELDFSAGSFDAVTAYYSITHVPREEHPELFRRIRTWLKPGGLFLASLSAGGSEDWTGDWLGVEMFFSGFDADANRGLLRDAGFELILDEVVTMQEPEGETTFLWVLARA
jgi:SAM-dependent methyltransferase